MFAFNAECVNYMPGGRPTVMTDDVIAKLEEAFSNGATDLQACFIANISKDSLYRYIENNPEFSERKEALKDDIKYKAKRLIKGEIEKGNVQQANWYLERKDKEFKPKQDLTTDDNPFTPVMVKFIDDKGNNNRDTNRVSEAV